ncbi:50S ribosomal protein L10 [Candidatus Peregrinibacteria bacterium]|nr:50S ribosomal protein L10 [Candidatus Peregrinibacteria bacterium]
MAVNKQKKGEILQELVDKFGRTKTVVYAENRGLSVKAISELRKQLRKEGGEFKISKKTLFRIAAKKNNLPEVEDKIMEGAVGAIFSYQDELAGVRILAKFAKGNPTIKILGGLFEGKAVGADIAQRYASIPTREVLLAKLMGSMKGPIQGFYSVLHGTMGGFVRALNAYKDKKPA